MSFISFEQNFIQHKNKLDSFALALTKDPQEAQELTQASALKALDGYAGFKEKTNFLAWFNTIQRNTFIDLYRKKKKHPLIPIENGQTSKPLKSVFNMKDNYYGAENQILIKDQHIIDFIQQTSLSDNQKDVVIKRFIDTPFKEIAQEAGVSVNTSLGVSRYAKIGLLKEFSSVENLIEALDIFHTNSLMKDKTPPAP